MQIESLDVSKPDVLRSILSLRNTSQPVNRLPPEILSRIARHVLGRYDRDARPIFPLTHVCRYWRESIVSAPENWILISDSCSDDLIALSLERAKAAALEISLSMNWVMQLPRLPGIITPHFQNVAALAVDSIPSFGEFTKVLPSFHQSLPNLRSLTLNVIHEEDWDLSIDPFESLSHTLRYLKLTNIHLYPSFLRLRTLTELSLTNSRFSLHLDTLLDFLEANDSLESVELLIKFVEPSLRNSQRRAAIGNRLQRLYLRSWDPMGARALIANIPLQKGGCLDISIGGAGLKEVLSGIPTTHLLNLPSPTFMEYRFTSERIRLQGPNGIFSFSGTRSRGGPFADLIDCPLISLANVREVRMTISTYVIPPLSHLPAIETLVIQAKTSSLQSKSFVIPNHFIINISHILSALLSNPASSPSLKTLVFLNCDDLSEDFMKKLTQFASIRQNTSTSARLCRVLIVHWEGRFPSVSSIQRLRNHVKIVDVRVGDDEVLTNSDIERYLAG